MYSDENIAKNDKKLHKKKRLKSKKLVKEEELEDKGMEDFYISSAVEETPKKKKKHKKSKVETSVAQENQNHILEEQEFETPKKKKKSKNKSFSSAAATDISPVEQDSPNMKKRKVNTSKDLDDTQADDLSATFASPVKKLKSTKKINLTQEQDCEFLKLALEQVSPSTKPYVSQFSKLDFGKIGASIEMTADECKSHLKELLEGITKTKCLHQLVTEALEILPSRQPSTSLCFSLYFLDNKKEISKVASCYGSSDKIDVALKLWQDLAEEERIQYERVDETDKLKNGMAPFDIFFDQLKNKDPSSTPTEARSKWKTIKLHKRIKYIRKSIELVRLLEVNHEDNADSSADHAEGDSVPKAKFRGPTKEDSAILFQYLQLPSPPPKMVALLFFEQHLSTNDKSHPSDPTKGVLIRAQSGFRELSEKEQKHWCSAHRVAWKDYEKKLEVWKSDQDPDILYYLKKKKTKPKKVSIREKATLKAKSKVEKRKEYFTTLHRIEMPMGNFKFPSEPAVPPLSAVRLFTLDFEKKTGKKRTPSKYLEMFRSLDKEKKDDYTIKLAAIREAYISGLKNYVSCMSGEQRRLFLGLKRLRYMKFFKDDIFEEYPSSEYPVYVQPTRIRPKQTVKPTAIGGKEGGKSTPNQKQTSKVTPRVAEKNDWEMPRDSDAAGESSDSEEDDDSPKASGLVDSTHLKKQSNSDSSDEEDQHLEAWKNSLDDQLGYDESEVESD